MKELIKHHNLTSLHIRAVLFLNPTSKAEQVIILEQDRGECNEFVEIPGCCDATLAEFPLATIVLCLRKRPVTQKYSKADFPIDESNFECALSKSNLRAAKALISGSLA